MSRTAIVTASDSGIGKATAVALAQAGFDVGITWHIDEDGAQGTAEEVRAAGRRAEVRRLDLEQLPGAVDAIDDLAGAGGRIVAVTSVHEHQPRVGAADYVTAKHGLGGLVKTAAIELGQHGITVNSVARARRDRHPADGERATLVLNDGGGP